MLFEPVGSCVSFVVHVMCGLPLLLDTLGSWSGCVHAGGMWVVSESAVVWCRVVLWSMVVDAEGLMHDVLFASGDELGWCGSGRWWTVNGRILWSGVVICLVDVVVLWGRRVGLSLIHI